MRLKKTLISVSPVCNNSGQIFMEYFILLVLVAGLTLVGSSLFFEDVQETVEEFTNEARETVAPHSTHDGFVDPEAEDDGWEWVTPPWMPPVPPDPGGGDLVFSDPEPPPEPPAPPDPGDLEFPDPAPFDPGGTDPGGGDPGDFIFVDPEPWTPCQSYFDPCH